MTITPFAQANALRKLAAETRAIAAMISLRPDREALMATAARLDAEAEALERMLAPPPDNRQAAGAQSGRGAG
jgi:hypothetical protein